MNAAAWTTRNELDFVRGMGSFTVRGQHQLKRTELLQRYRASLALRVNWGGIDAAAVIEAVDTELLNPAFIAVNAPETLQ